VNEQGLGWRLKDFGSVCWDGGLRDGQLPSAELEDCLWLGMEGLCSCAMESWEEASQAATSTARAERKGIFSQPANFKPQFLLDSFFTRNS
jgi:hypothetical protein